MVLHPWGLTAPTPLQFTVRVNAGLAVGVRGVTSLGRSLDVDVRVGVGLGVGVKVGLGIGVGVKVGVGIDVGVKVGVGIGVGVKVGVGIARIVASIFGMGVGTAVLVCCIPAWIVASIFEVGVGTAAFVCAIPARTVASISGVRVGSAVGPQAKVNRTINETKLYPFKVLATSHIPFLRAAPSNCFQINKRAGAATPGLRSLKPTFASLLLTSRLAMMG